MADQTALDHRVGVAQRVAPGEKVCGDAYAVVTIGNVTTIALADGLGHGPAAAEAASRFCGFVRDEIASDLERIVHGAHAALAHTRGVAAALARIDWAASTLEFTGVGNVELLAHSRQRIAPVCVPGIVGSRLRRTNTFRYTLDPSDVVVLYTDGIVGLSDLAPYGGYAPQRIADHILATFVGTTDDASCIAVRSMVGLR